MATNKNILVDIKKGPSIERPFFVFYFFLIETIRELFRFFHSSK